MPTRRWVQKRWSDKTSHFLVVFWDRWRTSNLLFNLQHLVGRIPSLCPTSISRARPGRCLFVLQATEPTRQRAQNHGSNTVTHYLHSFGILGRFNLYRPSLFHNFPRLVRIHSSHNACCQEDTICASSFFFQAYCVSFIWFASGFPETSATPVLGISCSCSSVIFEHGAAKGAW